MYDIDLSETIIPFSLLQIVNQFKRMKTGDIMVIHGIEDEIITDLMRVLPAGQFKLAGTEVKGADSPCFRLRLKKTDTPNTNQPKEKCHVSNRSEQR